MKRIFFARSADVQNLNAQAKNVQNILRGWRSTEYRPTVVSFYEPDAVIAANPNIDIVRIRPDHFWRVRWYLTYLRNFDAVFCPGLHHYTDWLALRSRAAFRRRLPIIATIEGLDGEVGGDRQEQYFSTIAGHAVYCHKLPGPQLRRGEALFEMADDIIAISPFLEKLATVRYGPKVSMLPLGVDTTLLCRQSWDRCAARPRVVGAGTVYLRKRPEIFVTLASAFPQADFVWFGEGPMREGLRAEVKRLALTNIEFPGALPPPALAAELVKSDIFVLPSRSEGVPKVTQEAAAAGLAQIIFGFYESPSVIDGKNGFVVWSDDECKARLSNLLESPDLIERMGRVGVSMSERWAWKDLAPQWERKIIDIVSSQSALQ